MRRIVLTTATLAALVLPGTALAAPAAEVPALSARLDGCEIGATSADRAADFTGAMPGAPGASVLTMRFDLEQRRGTTWKSVGGPGFRTWLRSAPGAAGLVFARRVERLAPGASYRVSVAFRWTDAGGHVVKRAERRSRICRQPDLRPDLTVVSVTPQPRPDGLVRYVARVRNDGPGAMTGPLRVALAVDATGPATQLVQGLAPGAVAAVAFDAPACAAGGSVRAEVDPGGDVEEADEGDNAFVLRCA